MYSKNLISSLNQEEELTESCGKYKIYQQAVDKKFKQVVALKKIFDAFSNDTDA